MDNKSIFAKNLKIYMERNGKTRRDICDALGFSYYTFSDWVNGKKYPRMDKVEMLADYFGILKSDLIEGKTADREEMQKKNDILSDIIARMRMDDDFLSLVIMEKDLDADQIRSVKALLSAFLK